MNLPHSHNEYPMYLTTMKIGTFIEEFVPNRQVGIKLDDIVMNRTDRYQERAVNSCSFFLCKSCEMCYELFDRSTAEIRVYLKTYQLRRHKNQ